MYIWNQSTGTCSGHSVTGNRVYWKNASGTNNPYWNAGNCGTVIESPANTLSDTSLNPAGLGVTL